MAEAEAPVPSSTTPLVPASPLVTPSTSSVPPVLSPIRSPRGEEESVRGSPPSDLVVFLSEEETEYNGDWYRLKNNLTNFTIPRSAASDHRRRQVST